MRYYPIFLDVTGRKCLVVGGGRVGARKAAALDKCGAEVTVVSLAFCPGFDDPGIKGVCCVEKGYDKKDLQGNFLVYAATDNAEVNRQVCDDCRQLNILCNVSDGPDDSDFILPSTVDRGDLIVAVSTSGASPAMARKIRQDLESWFGPEYETMLRLMKGVRKRLLAEGHAPDRHRQVFHALIEKGLLALIGKGDETAINQVLGDVLGQGYRFRELIASQE